MVLIELLRLFVRSYLKQCDLFSQKSGVSSGGVPSPRLAGSIPDRYPWVYCGCPIINKIRSKVDVKMNLAVPPEDFSGLEIILTKTILGKVVA